MTVLFIRDHDKIEIRRRPKKGLLAGLYELPNLEGVYSTEEIAEIVKKMDLSPIRVKKLEDAKHIFSHIEWKMEGYAVLVEEAGFESGKCEDKKREKDQLIFVDAKNSAEKYAIPSAFMAYAKYMNMKLGRDRFLEE